MRRILITGPSSGIGRQLALDYTKNSDAVIAYARSIDALKSLAMEYSSKIQTVKVDVSFSDVMDKFTQIKNIDKIILNACTGEYVDVKNFDSKLSEYVFQVNVLGVVYSLEALLPNINNRGQVSIVGSLARLLLFTRSAAYGASKAAINYLTKSLAVNFAGENFSVHSISPGFVKTPLTDKNDFPMPFLISTEQASARIIAGLESGAADISFPRKLSWILKFMSLFPSSLEHKISFSMDNKK